MSRRSGFFKPSPERDLKRPLLISLSSVLIAGVFLLPGCSDDEPQTNCQCGQRVCGMDPCNEESCGTCETGETCSATGVCEAATTSDAGAADSRMADMTQSDQGTQLIGGWVAIPAGVFTMGSPENEPCRFADERAHQVTLTRDFELQKTEVTQGEFKALMGYNPSTHAACGDNCPVDNTTWHEAAAYCNALSTNKGLTPCYSCSGSGATVECRTAPAYPAQEIYACSGYRLPTEAEWEYAYRAGTTSAYYSGDADSDLCYSCSPKDDNAVLIGWFCADEDGMTSPVGLKQANAWSLHDMAGNVWEWCHDWFRPYPKGTPVTDPVGLAGDTSSRGGPYRSLRGGGWNNYASYMRAASRDSAVPSSPLHMGFRCARTL